MNRKDREEIHQLGLREVARIEGEVFCKMRTILRGKDLAAGIHCSGRQAPSVARKLDLDKHI